VVRHETYLKELPVIPAGGQNTMAAAAVVLLAAHFEEYVRQQIEEYVKALILEYVYLDLKFKDKLIDSYWRGASSKLTRLRPLGDPLWKSRAEPLLRGLIRYPIEDALDHFVAATLCEHENNMRWETIQQLTGRIGIKDLSGLMFKSGVLKKELGNPRKDQFTDELRVRLNRFYETRNGIVHSIAQNTGIGTTVFDAWADFFRSFTTAFAEALDASYTLLAGEIEKVRTAEDSRSTRQQ
jgi:hypothetical protein